MKYNNIVRGQFIARDNRFIARVNVKGKEEVCHVKNTGRCRELLTCGAEVYLELSSNPQRKTRYSLIAVKKGNILINMDSQAPNKVVEESINKIFDNISYLRREYKFLNSRFDFYMEQEDIKSFIEVKGVTLENNGVVSFPDAPSERAVKHLDELIKAVEMGYKAYVIFVVQMKGINYFVPNYENHRAFADKLTEAEERGVNILAFDCIVTADELKIDERVEVCLRKN